MIIDALAILFNKACIIKLTSKRREQLVFIILFIFIDLCGGSYGSVKCGTYYAA